ncbi:M48 family metalloprotease [Altererythrobacter lutimaris]|uniref:Peptidase M48 domain-containing protein n=1 Tax=Altererythrobacter lutimaris TaxID=2743979 RepID=A0A850HCQ8_9SPHN|nr:hypothetical protein [Altererythrobacter lutimaris]NVE95330.1 hypothetical protein [Altererythrobacter lutimaris]
MYRFAAGLVALLLLAASAAAHALSDEKQVAEAAETATESAFEARLARDQKLQDLGWRLATANAQFCSDAAPSIGLQLLDTASFRRPDAIRKELGLVHDFAVLTAAARSPANAAGLKPLEPITHINGFELSGWAATEPFHWQRTERVHELLETMLFLHGEVRISQPNKLDVSITGQPACPTRFELAGGQDTALADGKRVRISADYPAFEYSDDELAALISHELAHNILRHRAWLDENGRKQKNVRLTEREADRLAPWLLANAGFEPEAALRFMRRWGPEHSGGLFRKRTHEGWDERAEHIAAEIPLVRHALSETGQADWRARFEREITLP